MSMSPSWSRSTAITKWTVAAVSVTVRRVKDGGLLPSFSHHVISAFGKSSVEETMSMSESPSISTKAPDCTFNSLVEMEIFVKLLLPQFLNHATSLPFSAVQTTSSSPSLSMSATSTQVTASAVPITCFVNSCDASCSHQPISSVRQVPYTTSILPSPFMSIALTIRTCTPPLVGFKTEKLSAKSQDPPPLYHRIWLVPASSATSRSRSPSLFMSTAVIHLGSPTP
mmetsp:Transcript_16276/g.36061  ORF Transcript_16276/g.36061 Transcript_16276/m.36061 type:complete len:226 (+) Transcript_16276:83-760(+)